MMERGGRLGRGASPSRISVSGAEGFTLPELMVVVLLMGILVSGVMGTFSAQKRATGVNSQIVDAQQASRLLGDLLEEDLRHTGMSVPEAGSICMIDRTADADMLFLTDATAIDPTSETRNDLGARIAGGGSNVGTGTSTFAVDSLLLEVSAPDAAFDTDGDGVNDSDFRVGGGVIVVDAGNPDRGAACGTVSAVALATSQLTVDILSASLAGLSATPEPVDLVAIPAHVYTVNADLQLLRNGLPIAGDVEDLQVAVFVDDDDDRVVDAGEYRGDGTGADFDPQGVDLGLVREVRASVVIRTRFEDEENSGGRFQGLENRAGAVINDGYRRRVYTSTVMLRNVGGRVSTT